MDVLDEVLKQISSANITIKAGYVVLDKYHTRIPRKQKKQIKKMFKR